MTEAKRRGGRPSLNRTPDEEIAARKEWRAKSKAKTKNVTIDADVLPLIYTAQKRLKKELGFEPTISQTLRALIKRAV